MPLEGGTLPPQCMEVGCPHRINKVKTKLIRHDEEDVWSGRNTWQPGHQGPECLH